jgi:hypothetical protein
MAGVHRRQASCRPKDGPGRKVFTLIAAHRCGENACRGSLAKVVIGTKLHVPDRNPSDAQTIGASILPVEVYCWLKRRSTAFLGHPACQFDGESHSASFRQAPRQRVGPGEFTAGDGQQVSQHAARSYRSCSVDFAPTAGILSSTSVA